MIVSLALSQLVILNDCSKTISLFTSSYSKTIVGGGNPEIALDSDLSWLLENTTYNSLSGATSNIYSNDNSYAYWTMSPCINQSYGGEYWQVNNNGIYRVGGTGNSGTGIRPVITVPKSYVTTN